MPLPLANSYPASAISFQLTSIIHLRKTKRTQFGAATLLTERTQFPPKSHKSKSAVRDAEFALEEADHKQRWSAPLVPGFEEFSMRLSSHFQNYTSGASVRNSIRGR